jgi:hypothetical protein
VFEVIVLLLCTVIKGLHMFLHLMSVVGCATCVVTIINAIICMMPRKNSRSISRLSQHFFMQLKR